MLSSHQTPRGASVETSTNNATSFIAWLCLAAAPTFAVMAIVAMTSSGADMVCSAMQDAFPVDGMTTMYLLMCVFHLPPWLRLMSGRTIESGRP